MSQLKNAGEETKNPRGQTMTEYALILATIAAVLITLYQNGGVIVSLLVSHVDPLL
jgi:Flp pilus assembly pilin Flp